MPWLAGSETNPPSGRMAGWPDGRMAVGHFILILIGYENNGRSKCFNMDTNVLDAS
jgi:hypothetical protein